MIVTGVGKSGHIGSKLAATLASTGTPAFFVHPAEANHGDLGMIARDDAIIAMSWSGESLELKGIIAYSRRFSIPLIAITSGARSALARESDVVLCLPKAREACPHGLAPTTSTLLQLVIGDALAVALLEARGFTPDHFRTFHPGGQLGASLMQVRDVMHVGDGAAARASRYRHAGGDPRNVAQGFWLRRHRCATTARWPASSPTATSGVTSPTISWRVTVDEVMTQSAEDGRTRDAGRDRAADDQCFVDHQPDGRRTRAVRWGSSTCTTCCASALPEAGLLR